MDITSKSNGDTLSATEFNQIPTELEALQTSSGQVSSDSILDQVSIGIARYAACNFYTDSGTANAYVLTPKGSFKSPVDNTVGYYDGMYIKFRAGNANTGASTVNVNSAGVKDLLKEDGSTALSAGDIPTTRDSIFRYDGTAFRLETGDASETAKGIIQLATSAEVLAATNALKAITPATLAGIFSSSLRNTDGYIRIPVLVGGVFVEMIFQWGQYNRTVGIGGFVAITFPVTFPTVCLNVTNSIRNTDSASTTANYSSVVSVSPSGATIGWDRAGAYWIAIGY